MQRAFKYRLYPSPSQARRLDHTLRLCRNLYNAALEQKRIVAKTVMRPRIGAYAQIAELPSLVREIPEYGDVYAQVLQDVLKRVEKNYARFYRRRKKGLKAGLPRFRSWRQYNSFTYPQAQRRGVKVEGGQIVLSKIGAVKAVFHRPVPANVKTLTVFRDLDRWFVVFVVDLPDPSPLANPPEQPVGIDLGLSVLATLSDGTKIGNPRFAGRESKRLRRLQRKVSRRHPGSRRREKALERFRRIQRTVRNKREDFAHRLSRRIIRSYDAVFVEDLDVAHFLRFSQYRRSVSDAGWGGLLSKLEYKAASAGIRFEKIPPEWTSQDCSACGREVPKTLDEGKHRCGCGVVLDRDLNAAKNILRLGLERLAGGHTIGPGRPESTPGENSASTVLRDGELGSANREALGNSPRVVHDPIKGGNER